MTNEEHITLLYRLLVRREPDSEGLHVFTGMLDQGTDLRKLVDIMVSGPEYVDNYKKYELDFSMKSQKRVLESLDLLKIWSVVGQKKTRIGAENDGGYVMLDDFSEVGAAYSIGISNDVSWDMNIANMNIPVFQYDHTIDQLPDHHPLFNWKRIGIGLVDNPEAQITSLETAVRDNNHAKLNDIILKLDAEGVEWDIFSSANENLLRQFRQIVCEFHHLNRLSDAAYAQAMHNAILNLTRNHRVIHVHGNNYSSWSLAGGVPIPETIEITFVRADDNKQLIPSNELFPTELDRPNHPHRADLYLGKFMFQRLPAS